MNVLEAWQSNYRFPDWLGMSSADFEQRVYLNSMCSAAIKMLPDFSDLFMAHSSWFTYASMNRIYKHYSFSVATPSAAKRSSFSSYPGILSSLDDFYLLDSGIALTQTTNSIFNNEL